MSQRVSPAVDAQHHLEKRPQHLLAEAMTWRSWRPRISAPPVLIVLIISSLSFLVGVFTSSFMSEFLQLSSRKPAELQPSTQGLNDFTSFTQNCTDTLVPPHNVTSFVLKNVFDGVSPFDDFPSNETAPLLRRKRIRGWGSTASVFARLMKEVRPAVILELGTFLGASAIHMGEIARNLSMSPVILCVDDFRGWPGFRDKIFGDIMQVNGNNMLFYQFMKNVQTMNLTDIIIPLPFSTAAALTGLCQWGIRPDLIEVDAAHDFHSAWLDLNLASYILNSGGVMFGHDYYHKASRQGVRRAVDLFARLNNLRVEPDGKHWILRSKSVASGPIL